MKRYAFFGGSFNPPTIAHKKYAELIVKEMKLDKVFFVPVGDGYKKEGLISEKYRYEMLKLMCKDSKKLDVCDIELNKNIKFKAIDVFKLIKNIYKDEEIYFVMGADNFKNILQWKDSIKLISNYKFILLNRNNIDLEKIVSSDNILSKYINNFNYINNNELIDINSTYVRSKIKEGNINIIQSMLDKNVFEFIIENKIYKE